VGEIIECRVIVKNEKLIAFIQFSTHGEMLRALQFNGSRIKDSEIPLLVRVAEIGFTSKRKALPKRILKAPMPSHDEYSYTPVYTQHSYGGDVVFPFVQNAMPTYPAYPMHAPMPMMSPEYGFQEVITVRIKELPPNIADTGDFIRLLYCFRPFIISATVEDRVGLIQIDGIDQAHRVIAYLNGDKSFRNSVAYKVNYNLH
jgi:hypothetical protein